MFSFSRRLLLLNYSLVHSSLKKSVVKRIRTTDLSLVHAGSFSSFQVSRLLIPPCCPKSQTFRLKSKKKQIEYDSDDESDEDDFRDDLDLQNVPGKVKKLNIQDTRLDIVLKAAVGTSRSKLTEAILGGKSKVNGSTKFKNYLVKMGDVIELNQKDEGSSEGFKLIKVNVLKVKVDNSKPLIEMIVSVEKRKQ